LTRIVQFYEGFRFVIRRALCSLTREVSLLRLLAHLCSMRAPKFWKRVNGYSHQWGSRHRALVKVANQRWWRYPCLCYVLPASRGAQERSVDRYPLGTQRSEYIIGGVGKGSITHAKLRNSCGECLDDDGDFSEVTVNISMNHRIVRGCGDSGYLRGRLECRSIRSLLC
jgi:hypothetical protein